MNLFKTILNNHNLPDYIIFTIIIIAFIRKIHPDKEQEFSLIIRKAQKRISKILENSYNDTIQKELDFLIEWG